jgi:hypothetical protein
MTKMVRTKQTARKRIEPPTPNFGVSKKDMTINCDSSSEKKSEKVSDDDIPFKTLFPNAFKVKVGSMKTKGSRDNRMM